jgi:hypothetical protein
MAGLGAMLAAAPSIANAMSEKTFELTADVPKLCSLSNTDTQQVNIPVTNALPETTTLSFTMTANCNVPSALSLTSTNGAILHETHTSGSSPLTMQNFAHGFGYIAEAKRDDGSTIVTLDTPSDLSSIQAGQAQAAMAFDQNTTIAGDVNLTLEITPKEPLSSKPLMGGLYKDDLVLLFGAAD